MRVSNVVEGPAANEGRLGCWNQLCEYRQHLFQWRIGEDYWQIPEKGQASPCFLFHVSPRFQYNIPRERYIISTKARFVVNEDDPSAMTAWGEALVLNDRDYANLGGLSRGALFTQVDQSLKRLGTTYIDILILQRFDPNTPYEETMKALHDLVQSGKIRYIGASNHHLWQLAEMNAIAEKNNWTTFTCVEVEHSLLYRSEVRNYSALHILSHTPHRNSRCSNTVSSKASGSSLTPH